MTLCLSNGTMRIAPTHRAAVTTTARHLTRFARTTGMLNAAEASQRCPDTSTSCPCGLALLHERLDADAKVIAAVTGAHEIIAVRQAGMENAADRLFAHAHRQRCMMGEARAQFVDPPVELCRRHDLAEKSSRQRLLGGKILRQQQHPLSARGAQ